MSQRKPKVTAWGWVDNAGLKGASASRAIARMHSPGAYRVVRLVEHDPAAAAVVKAARKLAKLWATNADPHGHGELDLRAAVERLEKKRGGR